MRATHTGTAQIRELPAGETHLAHQAMCTLQTGYESEQALVEHVDGVLRPNGLQPGWCLHAQSRAGPGDCRLPRRRQPRVGPLPLRR